MTAIPVAVPIKAIGKNDNILTSLMEPPGQIKMG
jgi:hypothetical protein